MDTKKIGTFLKQLRKEKGLTQEQLAERLGVSNRTVSRWENGNNLPDFDVLLLIGQLYEVSVEELLHGHRLKTEDIPTAETITKVAEYTGAEQARMTKRFHYMFIAGAVGILVFLVIYTNDWMGSHLLDFVAGMGLGIGWGMTLVGAIFTSPLGQRLRGWKMAQFRKLKR